ncbi:hypothetical protein [Thermopetrobacter sp. TC1]|uniref:hypothetical protein n=1 Tax=Thermopetrobacter sp. TC1 TaxID=1495045 RepID=UPI0012E0B081|nr:hypothetical protein [Thermopetrobacter sp. TC1]
MMIATYRQCRLLQKIRWVWFALKNYAFKKFIGKAPDKIKTVQLPNNRKNLDKFILENAKDMNLFAYYLFYNNLTEEGYILSKKLEKELSKYLPWKRLLSLDKNDYRGYYDYTSEQLIDNIHSKTRDHLTIKRYQGEPIDENDAILMFPGIGDEISACVLFSMIEKRNLNIYCDHRLKPIIESTFEGIRVHPVRRINPFSAGLRELLTFTDHFCNLPTFHLAKFMDGRTLSLLGQYRNVYSVFDLLAHHRTDDNYRHVTYFKPARSVSLPEIPKGKKRVGIFWRSLSRKGERDMYALPEKAVRTILNQGDAIFVNLQYRSRFTHDKMINPNIDKVNDIEGLCALVKELDLVIGPATATVRISAMSGTPTLIYSAGLVSKFYRDAENRDKRMPLTRHIPCDNVSDVDKATQEIIDIINDRKVIDFS